MSEVPDAPVLIDMPARPGVLIGKRLMMVESGGQRAVFLGSAVIHLFDVGDKGAEAACMAMLSRAGLATDQEIAGAFGCHRNTVVRAARRLADGGIAAVVPAKPGPRGPHKVTAEVLELIEEEGAGLPSAALRQLIHERAGVALSERYVRRLTSHGRAVQTKLLDVPGADAGDVADGDGSAAVEDDVAVSAAAIERDPKGEPRGIVGEETTAAFDPPATLPAEVRGRYMGLALYYPALAGLGLVEIARSLFRLPRSERFGVRSTVLSVFFMTLLSRTTLESAKHLRRREFGAMIGSGRAPSVKTLRRKFLELVGQRRAGEMGVQLARRWVQGGVVSTAYLYVDGHMKQYSGKRHLQEVWNSQRRMPLPGIHTYFVNDAAGRPLLFLTEPLSTSLARAMPRIIEAIREVIGERRFTVIFDRGGYDGKLFHWLREQQIDFITYQRGEARLPVDAFVRHETRFEGRRIRFRLAEDAVRVSRSGPWRRIVVLTKDGHQTPILTSLEAPQPTAARIACLMFARWRQENLFKYMGEHHGLDKLISYAWEPAGSEVTVPNPERKRVTRLISERRQQLSSLKQGLGDVLLDEPRTDGRSAHGLKIAQGGAVGRLRQLEDEVERLVLERRSLPTHVSATDTTVGREVMRLEHKAIVDRIKISAYNAEEWLLDRLIRHYPNPHDVRDLLRAFAELSGEITTTARGVIVTLDPPDTPMHRSALRGLIDDLNDCQATFPGTQVPVVYQVAVHHSQAAA